MLSRGAAGLGDRKLPVRIALPHEAVTGSLADVLVAKLQSGGELQRQAPDGVLGRVSGRRHQDRVLGVEVAQPLGVANDVDRLAQLRGRDGLERDGNGALWRRRVRSCGLRLGLANG